MEAPEPFTIADTPEVTWALKWVPACRLPWSSRGLLAGCMLTRRSVDPSIDQQLNLLAIRDPEDYSLFGTHRGGRPNSGSLAIGFGSHPKSQGHSPRLEAHWDAKNSELLLYSNLLPPAVSEYQELARKHKLATELMTLKVS